MTEIRYYTSPLGPMLIEAECEALTGLWFIGQKNFPEAHISAPPTVPVPLVLLRAEAWLERYFAGERPSPFELELSPRGSEFRRRVWEMLLTIPYGETASYGDMAKKLQRQGIKASAQAVGGAVGHNPISIIIPCHRVIGADGSLTGYAGGLERKTALLLHERR